MSAKNKDFYEFGEFQLDADERTLRRGDEFLPLAPKVFDTLQLLVENQGKILSKPEMMNALWADAFVEESNLSQNIYTLRRILGKEVIENVPRRGYRFIVPVRRSSKTETNGASEILIASQTRVLTEEIFEVETPAPQNIEAGKTQTSGKSFFRSPFVLLSALAFVALLFSVFVGFRYFTSKSQPAPVESVSFQKLTFSGDVKFPVIAPDGNSFSFVQDERLFVQDVGSRNPVQVNVEGFKDFGFVQFSVDGKSLYFRSPSVYHLPANLYQVSRFGGTPNLVAENVWSGFSFSKDGRFLAFIRNDVKAAEYFLVLKNLETGEERNVCSYKLPARFYIAGFPAFSSDGSRIATVVFKQGGFVPASQIVVVETETGKIEEIETPAIPQIEQVVWTPDASAILLVGREENRHMQLWRLDVSSRELKRVTNDLTSYRNISLSTDGKKLLARQHTTFSHLWLAPSDDFSKAAQVTFGNSNRDAIVGVVFAPDGSIVYTSRISGNTDLWHFNPKNGSRRQLTENAGDANIEPTFSPDGKFIYFNSIRSGALRVWRMDIRGENQTQLTFGENETERFPQISPDGQWLYYIQRGKKVSTIQRKSLTEDKTEILLTPEKVVPDAFLALSPDGRFLLFNDLSGKQDEGGKQLIRIGVIAAEGNSDPLIFNLPAPTDTVRWTSDGKAFDYVENNADGAKIWRQSLNASEPRRLILELPEERISYFAWSADGKNLALSRGKQSDDAILLTNF